MMVTTSKPLYLGLALWCIITGILLTVDAALPDTSINVISPFDDAPRWVTDSIAKFYLIGGACLLFALLWRGHNLRPAFTAGKLAWIGIATAGFTTAVITITYQSQALLTGVWAGILVPVALAQLHALLRRERLAYRAKDQRNALNALNARLEPAS